MERLYGARGAKPTLHSDAISLVRVSEDGDLSLQRAEGIAIRHAFGDGHSDGDLGGIGRDTGGGGDNTHRCGEDEDHARSCWS